LRFVTPIMLAIILATKLYALITEGYGGYDLTLGWALIAALFIFGLVINAVNRKETAK
ncbi:sodium-dependent transporter, partial [Vibrio parahaemolyticus]|nr:sodium-dependent transporter [Vibrio parahaemolyticus]